MIPQGIFNQSSKVMTSLWASPNGGSVYTGKSFSLTVLVYFSDGSFENVTTSASYVRTNTRITVNSNGTVSGVTAGASGVNISYEGLTTIITCTVILNQVVELIPLDNNFNVLTQGNMSQVLSNFLLRMRIRMTDGSVSTITSGNFAISPSSQGPVGWEVFDSVRFRFILISSYSSGTYNFNISYTGSISSIAPTKSFPVVLS